MHLSTKYRNGIHVREPCKQGRKEQERGQNIEKNILCFAQQASPIHSTSTETVSGDLNMSIPRLGGYVSRVDKHSPESSKPVLGTVTLKRAKANSSTGRPSP